MVAVHRLQYIRPPTKIYTLDTFCIHVIMIYVAAVHRLHHPGPQATIKCICMVQK